MKVWIIEPRDPFIARDGKPFEAGMRAATLPFPFPSTTTGGVRTRAGLDNGIFNPSRQVNSVGLIDEVKKIKTRGPLLVELEGDEIETWFMPAPADALLLEDQTSREIQIKRLVPLEVDKRLTNLDQEPHGSDDLAPVGFTTHDPRKPFDKIPRFWRWDNFGEWLLDPDKLALNPIEPKELGHSGAMTEARTHVAIDPQSLTTLEGQLFQTRGLEFTRSELAKLGEAKRLALAVCVEDAALSNQIKEGLAPLGGERRIVAWRESKKPLPDTCLATLQDRIAEDEACRLILLTPGYFVNGSSPTELRRARYKVESKVKAIATGRAQVVSGWDLAPQVPTPPRGGLPKATRRLAPAGAVFFLSLKGDKADIKTWVEKMWMQCVSDDASHRNDGFGLAALGVWNKNGQLQPMKVE